MIALNVTARGKVTGNDLLQRPGIKPGEKIELDPLPDGRGMPRVAHPTGAIEDFVGLLAGRTGKVATIEEIHEGSAQAWAGMK